MDRVKGLHPPGRFLELKIGYATYTPMAEHSVLEKVCQMHRDLQSSSSDDYGQELHNHSNHSESSVSSSLPPPRRSKPPIKKSAPHPHPTIRPTKKIKTEGGSSRKAQLPDTSGMPVDTKQLVKSLEVQLAFVKPRAAAQKEVTFTVPHDYDVLFGRYVRMILLVFFFLFSFFGSHIFILHKHYRGHGISTHPGNVVFRQLCWVYRFPYNKAHRYETFYLRQVHSFILLSLSHTLS
jgi:hypothetical protein